MQTDNMLNVFTLFTDIDLKQEEVPLFRGAMIRVAGSDNVDFHDHESEGFRYLYPRVQYKIIDHKASVVFVGEGAESIGKILYGAGGKIQIGRRSAVFNITGMPMSQSVVQVNDISNTYKLSRWLPLNQDNYELFSSLESLQEKCALLERLLIGNILSFAKGVGIFFDSEVEVNLVDIEKMEHYKFKNVKMLGFDVVFRTNVSLPQYVGLGKGVSLGFGIITNK